MLTRRIYFVTLVISIAALITLPIVGITSFPRNAEAITTVISSDGGGDINILPGNTMIITPGVSFESYSIVNRGTLIVQGYLSNAFTVGDGTNNYGFILITDGGKLDTSGEGGGSSTAGGPVYNHPGATIQLDTGGSLDVSILFNQGTINNYGFVSLEDHAFPGSSYPENRGLFINREINAAAHAFTLVKANTVFKNFGTFTNDGNLQNDGTFSNECGSTYNGKSSGFPPGGNPIVNGCSSFPVIHMQDTTATSGSLVQIGRRINAEWAKPGSQLIGDKIDSITLRLARTATVPPGTFTVGVYDANLNLKRAFGVISPSTLTTTYKDIEYKLPANDPLYTIVQDDRIGLFYNGGSASVGINVMIDRSSADPFDGSNSQRVRYESGWLYYDTSEDLFMTLKQTHG